VIDQVIEGVWEHLKELDGMTGRTSLKVLEQLTGLRSDAGVDVVARGSRSGVG